MENNPNKNLETHNMNQNSTISATYVVSLLVTGLGIGLLIGLSISPVVSIVVTSVTGSAAAIVAVMSGLEHKSDDEKVGKTKNRRFQPSVNPVPIALLVFGIVIGAGAGIFARTHNTFGDSTLANEVEQWTKLGLGKEEVARRLFEKQYSYRGWFGSDLSAEIDKWTNAGMTDREEVTRRIFESTYPVDYEWSASSESTQVGGTKHQISVDDPVLFAVSATECDSLVAKALAGSPEALVRELQKTEALKELPNIVNDPQILEKIVTEVLCP